MIVGVTEKLREHNFSIEMIHWRPGFLWRAKQVAGGIVTDPHGHPPRSLVASFVKLAMLAVDWWLAWPWILRRPRATGRFLFSDRYYDDLLVDPRRYRFGGPTGLARFVFRFLPKPDCVIVLTGDPAAIHARKREVSMEEMERQILAYRALAASLGPRAFTLDACCPLAEVVDAAYEEIMRVLNGPGSPANPTSA